MVASAVTPSDEISIFENHGTLSSDSVAFDADDDPNSDGISNWALTATHVINTGDIRGEIKLGGFDD
ncbi:hypothetical protein OO012_09110 [Rhodobacteraceae bacterium KMM 6894]|nr:hypothetical protein [Rhodobacteraceae bacterium KMM 6894]